MTSQIRLNKELQQSERYDEENSEHQNNYEENNKINQQYQRMTILNRKTSKRRQAQEQKAAVLEIFKELLTVVNQKFTAAKSLDIVPKVPKIPKGLKIQKNQPTTKMNKKDIQTQNINITLSMSMKNKREDIVSQLNGQSNLNNIHKLQSKQKREKQLNINNNLAISQQCSKSQPNLIHYNNINNHNSNSSERESIHNINNNNNSNNNYHHYQHQYPYSQNHLRKSSESYTHKERSLSEKNQLLQEHLKKEILENYGVLMRYIVHQDMDKEVIQEEFQSQNVGKNKEIQQQQKQKSNQSDYDNKNISKKHNQQIKNQNEMSEQEFFDQDYNIVGHGKSQDADDFYYNAHQNQENSIQGNQQDIIKQADDNMDIEEQQNQVVGAFNVNEERMQGIPHAHTTQEFLEQNKPIQNVDHHHNHNIQEE